MVLNELILDKLAGYVGFPCSRIAHDHNLIDL